MPGERRTVRRIYRSSVVITTPRFGTSVGRPVGVPKAERFRPKTLRLRYNFADNQTRRRALNSYDQQPKYWPNKTRPRDPPSPGVGKCTPPPPPRYRCHNFHETCDGVFGTIALFDRFSNGPMTRTVKRFPCENERTTTVFIFRSLYPRRRRLFASRLPRMYRKTDDVKTKRLLRPGERTKPIRLYIYIILAISLFIRRAPV